MKLSIVFVVVLLMGNAALQCSLVEASPHAPAASRHALKKPPSVVLVHGFSGGGWTWYKVRLSLELMGYNVTSLDLKGGGIDPTDASTIDSFDEYNEPLDRFMARLPRDEKVVIVGNSTGGVSLTKVLHDYPDKVQVAIYFAATMIRNGYTTCDHLVMGYMLGKSLTRKGSYRAICTSKFTDKTTWHQKKSIDEVPRVYVKTLYDRTLNPEEQAAMIRLWPPCQVHEITNDHDALYSKPELISGFIVGASIQYDN